MKSDAGVSLVESLLVVVMAGFIVALMANLPNAMSLVSKSNHLSLAREIASKQIEDTRNIKYVNLVNNNSPIADSRLSSLPQGFGTLIIQDCPIQICTNGEAVKQVISTITWMDLNKTQTVTLNALIGEGGLNQ